MKYYLENQRFKVEFECYGAEIKSVYDKQLKVERMWSANPDFWGKTAPLLFPFIGKLCDMSYTYQGQKYPADKHGFGQRVVYKVVHQSEDTIRFQFKDTPETREKYPFSFTLTVEYVLKEDGIVENWTVENTGEEPMYFSIGGHGAFACPILSKEEEKLPVDQRKLRIGQIIKLFGMEDTPEILSHRLDANGLITEELISIPLDHGCFPITEDLFAADALIFDNENIKAVGLLSEDWTENVRLYSDAPVWGIWSYPDSRAGYVCLEPWYGICDFAGFEGSLEERPHTQVAYPGKPWGQGIVMKFL